MKTATICHEVPCDQSVAERPRYYPRQLITPDDLNLEQDYFRSKLRWHNRMLHGWGVVCGALVCKAPKSKANGTKFEPWQVIVKPGYILGPYGDEIILDCTRLVDLRTRGVSGITGEPCVEAVDPWCSDVAQEPESSTLYVAVRYKEIQARPVRVQPVGCGCDDTQCENSRLVDGYEISVLTYCPESHQTPPDAEDLTRGSIPLCPPCPDEPWVVLAKVELDADGNITEIDNCACKRLVLSLGNFWWHCDDAPAKPDPAPGPAPGPSPSPRPGAAIKVDRVETRPKLAPASRNQIILFGENLDLVQKVSFGDGINVEEMKAVPRELLAVVTVDRDAKPGARTISLFDKSNSEIKVANLIAVEAGSSPAQPINPVETKPAGPGSPIRPQDPKTKPKLQKGGRKKRNDEEV